jgi:hypothetical protein
MIYADRLSFSILNKSSFIIIISVICVLLNACNKENAWDCIQTTGDMITEEREISNFKRIQLEDQINLIITQDTVESLSIDGGENLLPEIITEITGDTLIIRNENSCNWVRRFDIPINVYVSVVELSDLYLYGWGSIHTSDTLKLDSLRTYGWNCSSKIDLLLNTNHAAFFPSTGSADINIKGITNSLYIYSAGFAIADTRAFLSKQTHVNSSGTGDFYVYASEKLTAEIRSYGNVYYKGSPFEIDSVMEGMGKLIKLD